MPHCGKKRTREELNKGAAPPHPARTTHLQLAGDALEESCRSYYAVTNLPRLPRLHQLILELELRLLELHSAGKAATKTDEGGFGVSTQHAGMQTLPWAVAIEPQSPGPPAAFNRRMGEASAVSSYKLVFLRRVKQMLLFEQGFVSLPPPFGMEPGAEDPKNTAPRRTASTTGLSTTGLSATNRTAPHRQRRRRRRK